MHIIDEHSGDFLGGLGVVESRYRISGVVEHPVRAVAGVLGRRMGGRA
jgi:hypothetical protein